MKLLSACLLLALLSFGVCAQCNTTLEKLIPETSVNNDDRFGSALAANGQYLVVAAENSDTLGILYGGAAFVYEKTAGGWAYRAMLKPSDPDEYGFFGTDIDIDASGNTIVVIDRSYPHNRIYVFEKPDSGWETTTETVKMQSPDYSDFNTSVNVSVDATKIVVGHPWSKESKFVVFYEPETGWNSAVVAQIFSSTFFGTSISLFAYDIVLQGDYLYASCSGDGLAIYVYKLNGPAYQYLAKLSVTAPTYSVGHFGEHLTATEGMVACTGAVFNPDGDSGMKIFLFKKHGEWTHATETAQFEIPGTDFPTGWHFPLEFISPTELAASAVLRGEEWSVGKVFIVKQTEGTWANLSTQVIFQESGLHLRSAFALKMVWNGSDLVRSVGTRPVGFTARDAVVSLTHSDEIWGSLQHVTLSRYNSASFYFGNAVHKTGKTLFAGAPYDGTSGSGAGAVYVYEKSGDTFQKVHTIIPGRRNARPTGEVDAGFGYSITSFGDELAIGAPSYLYGQETLGKIFLYRRTGSSWSSAMLYDSVSPPPELMLNHVGATIVMNEHVLFATAYNNRYSSHNNAIVVFERVNGKWTYMDVIMAGRPFDKSWPSLKLSLHGDKLLAGSYYSLEGGTFIFEKDETTGKWMNTALFGGGVYSSYGSDVKLLENHFFVGVPAYPWKGVANSGAVMVYAKLPGQQWNKDMTPVATIGPEVSIEGSNFGSSIDVIGNTLVVGAPGSFLTQNSQVRTIPGNTYIIQAEDYYWQNTTEFLNLQGERHASSERDYFGFDVGVDVNYVGCNKKNTQRKGWVHLTR
ncbi:MAG: hypothetical protein WD824_13045 [Cyclobacteriaceae bacterium]